MEADVGPQRSGRSFGRAKSFHQAFREVKEGAVPEARGPGETRFQSLYLAAFQQTYATRPPDDNDDDLEGSGGGGMRGLLASPSAGGRRAGVAGSPAKNGGRFAGAVERMRALGGGGGAASPFGSRLQQLQQQQLPAGAGGGEEQAAGVSSSSRTEGVEGCAGEAGREQHTREGSDAAAAAGKADQEEEEEPDDDVPVGGEEGEEEGEDDPAALAAASEFEALGSGEGGGGGGGMLADLKKVFDTGGAIDDSEDKDGGGGGGGDKKSAGSSKMKEDLKKQMDSGKAKMEEAEGSLKKFMSEAKAESAGGGGLGGLVTAMKAAAKEGLADMAEGLDDLPGGKLLGGLARKASSKVLGGKKGGEEPAKEPRPVVKGQDPWLPHGLSPEQVAARAKARAFVEEHVMPHAAKWHEDRTLPRKALRAAGKNGYCAMTVGQMAGGEGWSHVTAAGIYEVVGAGDLNFAALLAGQNHVAGIMGKHAPLLMKLSLTRALASGLVLGSVADYEPLMSAGRGGGGAELGKTLSFAVEYKDQSGDYWIINGLKSSVPLCGQADLYLVVARTTPPAGNPAGGLTLFVLPKFYPGMFWVGPRPDALGCPAATASRRNLVFACCIVRAETRVAPDKAAKVLGKAVDSYRLALASAAVGAAATSLTLATTWLADPSHRHFAHELIGYPALAHRLVVLRARVDGARLLALGAAAAADARDKGAPGHAAVAKRYCVECALEVVEALRPLFGAASAAAAFPLARLRRNLLALRLLGGDGEECLALAWKGVVSKRKTKTKGGKKGKKPRQPGGKKEGKKEGKDGEQEEKEDGEEEGGDGGTEGGEEGEDDDSEGGGEESSDEDDGEDDEE